MKLLTWAGLLFSLVLTGCAAGLTASVTSFHEISQDLNGQTFALVPSSEQDGRLEHKTYALLVKQQLERRGLKEVPLNVAKYAVTMAYGIDDGKVVTSSYPIYGQTGSSGSSTSGRVSTYGNTSYLNATTTKTPTYGVVGSGVSSDTEFTRFLNLNIIDLSKSTPEKPVTVYEGKVRSTGSSGQLATVMPAIVRSVFKEFPGKSGFSRTVQEPLEEK